MSQSGIWLSLHNILFIYSFIIIIIIILVVLLLIIIKNIYTIPYVSHAGKWKLYVDAFDDFHT